MDDNGQQWTALAAVNECTMYAATEEAMVGSGFVAVLVADARTVAAGAAAPAAELATVGVAAQGGSGGDKGSGSGFWRHSDNESDVNGYSGAPEVAAACRSMGDALAVPAQIRYDVSALEKVQERSVVLVGSYWQLMLSTSIPLSIWDDSLGENGLYIYER